MDADLIKRGDAVFAPLSQFAVLAAAGEDARAFLHAQLSNDVEHLSAPSARRAGYCSPKGRLLANFLVIARPDGFLLQVSADIAAAIAKRLTMYVLRSKVKIADVSSSWQQFGVWGRDASALLRSAGFDVPQEPMQASEAQDRVVVALGEERFLVLGQETAAAALAAKFTQVGPEWWTLAEVRAGLAQVTQPTQDQFVPQMANFELIGAIDFKKGCYPGQETVARAQYRGQVKRRMYRGEVDATGSAMPAAGQDLFDSRPQAIGTIVNVAPRPEGGYEILGVIQASAVEEGEAIRVGAPEGPVLRIASLPYTV
jgi:folate-binding protein YgfZ